MGDPGIHDALQGLEPEEIDAVERFVRRLREEGWICLETAERWRIALDRAWVDRLPLRRHQG